MHRLFALLAALALLACGQPEPWEPTADREARAIDRLLWLLEPSEAHAQLFPSTLDDTLFLGKGRYNWVQLESAQKLTCREPLPRPNLNTPNL